MRPPTPNAKPCPASLPSRVQSPPLAPLAVLVVCLALATATTAQNLPQGFQDSVVLGGFEDPTLFRFAPDGRVFVGQKDGLIYTFDDIDDTTPTLFADLSTNVYDVWDRGLLGLAVSPGWPLDPYVYVMYTYDAPPGGSAPTWNDDCPDPPGFTNMGCVASGRLSRLEAAGDVMTGTEVVLIEDWCQQFPSHSVGDLGFGPDGALYATAGDGASFNFVDFGQAGNPCNDPPGEGGALRCQDLQTPGDPVALNGTLLRLDPVTGMALSDNPLFGGADASDDRVIAYGLRNPFRFAVHPLSGEVWIGDVGWARYEEINRVVDPVDGLVENFGWPCYEGTEQQIAFDTADVPICENLYIAQTAIDPFYTYFHGVGGAAITGLAFYIGGDYPAGYEGALFFGDNPRGLIYVMFPDGSGTPDPANIVTFSDYAKVVDMQVGPDGDIYYVNNVTDDIHHIEYFGMNIPPTSVIQVDVSNGPSPFTVQFDGTGSSDPDVGDMLVYAWELDGDESFDDSTDPAPQWTYAVSGSFPARLRVTDLEGASDISTLLVTVDNGPPVISILSPLEKTTWRVGDTIPFSGQALDPDDGLLATSAFAWDVVLLHCAHDDPEDCHEHITQQVTGVDQGSFVAIDHEFPSFLQLRVSATDEGLADWWDANWTYRKRLTFDNSGQPEPLADFPVLVRLDPTRIDYSRVGAAGEDLRFVALNGSTTVPFEVETWNPGGVSDIWVRAPRIGGNSEADAVWIYYGNASATDGQSPGAVWDASYKGVWHLGASLDDSTLNGNTGVNTGSVEVAGRIGQARFFDGVDDAIDVGSESAIAVAGDLTIEVWIQVGDPLQAGSPRVLSKKVQWDPTSGFNIEYQPLSGSLSSSGSGSDSAGADGVNLDLDWHQVVVAISGGTAAVYLDGVDVTTDATITPVVAGTHRLVFGRRADGGEHFQGGIDEVRLSNVRRSRGWIEAQYRSMSDNFVSFSPETGISQLTTQASVTLQPETSHLTLRSLPPGLELVIYSESEPSPSVHEVIVNGVTTLTAPSPQLVDGTMYEFVSWSDGGAATHEITLAEEDQVLTAIFRSTRKRVHTRESLQDGVR